MSERTISPGLDHINSLPERTSMDNGSAAQALQFTSAGKRKWSPDHSDASTATLISQHDTLLGTDTVSPLDRDLTQTSKRARVEGNFSADQPATAERIDPLDKSRLPAEMWQYIFTYLPPYSLGNLICVNKTFKNLLAPGGTPPGPRLAGQGHLGLMEPDFLWSLSRRAFFPAMPRPLFSRSELDTWKLIRSDGCEYCGKRSISTVPLASTSPWAAGPGNDCVRVIWPFAVRSCGKCLQGLLRKETDLLFSSSSALMPAIPFAFLTPSLNYVASITLRSEPPPTGLQLTKWFFGPQVDKMKIKLDEVKELGAATAEEWFKGLEADGREKLAETARWERWELAGGFQAISHSMSQTRNLHRPPHEVHLRYATTSDEQSSSRQEAATPSFFPSNMPIVHGQTRSWTNQAPASTLPHKPATPVSHYALAYPGATPNFSVPVTKAHARVERSIYDVNEKKNARRAEIERRCAELDPPISPSTLALMDSFAAAVQIAMPLTDQAWELLRPRLLAQCEAAEQQERERLAQNQSLMKQNEERKQQEAQLREAKEILDREWAESQKSVREKLELYADSFIREQWQNGDGVTKSSCAQFAADMLLHVRHRFYNTLAQEDARMRSMGVPIPADSPHAAPTRKLTLENMRWVYENKIKPLTEHLQKELFLCNACDNHGRYYSLDSVVQHFAAKHTDSLSMGTTVVYWKADWPELPPFDPNPTAAKASLYAAENTSPAPAPIQLAYNTPPTSHGYAAGTYVFPNPTMYSSSSNGQYAYQRHKRAYDSASSPYEGPSSPQNTFQRLEQGASRWFNPPPQSASTTVKQYGALPSSDLYNGQDQGSSLWPSYQNPAQASHSGMYDLDARSGPAISYRSQNPPLSSVAAFSTQFSRPQAPTGVRQMFNPVSAGQPTGIYQVQIQDLAHNAREIWNGTSGILDMPDSIRVQVIIRHVVLRFKEKYTNEPNLALFTDGLNNNSQMSPMRALSGLYCKACTTTNQSSGAYGSNGTRALEHRMHTLPALLAHFQSAHVEHVQPIAISPTSIEMPRLDWKFDMVEMPAVTVVGSLIYSPGITQAKLNLIATVLPGYFPSPLPQADPIPHPSNDNETTFQPDSRKASQEHSSYKGDDRFPEASFDNSGHAVSQFPRVQVVREDSSLRSCAHSPGDTADRGKWRPAETARDDEYDPHRPAYVNASQAQRPSLAPAYSHNDRPHGEYEGPSLPRDRIAGQKVEADHLEHRISPSSDHALLDTDRPRSTRVNVGAENFPGRHVPRLQPEARWANQETRLAQVERRPTPARESYNAAEQFLRSFDITSETLQEPNQQPSTVATSQTSECCPGTNGDTFFRPRSGNWLPNIVSDRTVEFSGKLPPSHPASSQERYEAADHGILEPRQSGEYEGQYGGHLAEPDLRSQRSVVASPDRQTSSRARAVRLPAHLQSVRDSPSRRPNSRFERYEAQRQGSPRPLTRSPALLANAFPVGDERYRHQHQMQRTGPRQVYAAEPEERPRGYPYSDEIMYRRALEPTEQIHYIEKARYLEPTYDRQIEYVRVAPRDLQAASGYYVQRSAPQNAADSYAGYEPDRPHEQVFQRNGRLYTRAPASPQDCHGPYARQTTYQ